MPSELYAIALVLALLALLAWWSRKASPRKRRLAILETAALGQGRAVALIEVGGKRLLIGVTSQSISTLAELQPREDAPPAEPGPRRLLPVESEAS